MMMRLTDQQLRLIVESVVQGESIDFLKAIDTVRQHRQEKGWDIDASGNVIRRKDGMNLGRVDDVNLKTDKNDSQTKVEKWADELMRKFEQEPDSNENAEEKELLDKLMRDLETGADGGHYAHEADRKEPDTEPKPEPKPKKKK